MKKLIMMCAVVAMASVVHASSFSWGLMSGKFDATKFANGTAYLFYGSNGGALSLPVTTAWANKTGFTYDDVVASGATLLASADIQNGLFDGTGANTSYGTLVTADVGASTAVKQTKFYLAVISDDGKNVALSSTVLTKPIANSSTVVGATWSSSAINTWTAKEEEEQGGGGEGGAGTPEPTSAMLMLFGMAGLALRRKQK